MVNDYPEIPLLTYDSQKEIKKVDTTLEKIEQAIATLRNEEDHENCLLQISRYYLYSGTLILIRFEEFGTDRDGKRFFNIFSK